MTESRQETKAGPGPLSGIRVLEIAGLGPAPFAAMLLADMGADVIRVDRLSEAQRVADRQSPSLDVLNRGKKSIAVDLKDPAGIDTVLRLAATADVLIEGFRPGVAERLGIGPDECCARNQRLVYGRMTGWGQEGPYAAYAGHDINYIALAGVLAHIGRPGEPPAPPLSLVGDFGGGGLLLAFGVLCALMERERSGRGQVIDSAMVDGAALLSAQLYGMRAAGMWNSDRGANLIDGGAPFYDTYETADGKYVAFGSIEPQFYARLVEALGLPEVEQLDHANWPRIKAEIVAAIKTRTQDEWCAELEKRDLCFAPVLDMGQAHRHTHNVHRRTFVQHADVLQPAPAPRLSRTPGVLRTPPPQPGRDTDTALAEWGFAADAIRDLRRAGTIG